jgi:hypothetical protein
MLLWVFATTYHSRRDRETLDICITDYVGLSISMLLVGQLDEVLVNDAKFRKTTWRGLRVI